ncbi:MAG: serine protease [Candidatus Obscuribacterales bacterium]|nr:serine protease [Candidatus Obscuribacterales bacterium]
MDDEIARIVTGAGTETSTQTRDRLWDEWKNSVVKIKTDGGTGTGFFVDDHTIATNYHIVKGSRNFTATDLNNNVYQLGERVFADPQHDLALITIHGPRPQHIKPFQIATGDVNQAPTRLFHLGHPLARDLTFIEGRVKGLADERQYLTATNEVVSPSRQLHNDRKLKDPANASFLSQELLVVEADGVTHGSSGSPFINAKGEVVAIVSKGINHRDGIVYCEPGKFLNRLIANSRQESKVDLPETEFVSSVGKYETGIEHYFNSLRYTPKVWFRDSIPLGIAGTGAALSQYSALNQFMEKKSPIRVNPGLTLAGTAIIPLAVGDLGGYNGARDSLTETKYGLALGADATMAAGFAKKTLANAIKPGTLTPLLGRAGVALGVVGVAGRLATELIPHHYSVTVPFVNTIK